MSEEHAFALKDAYVGEDSESPFAGATMAYGPDGRTADLGQMLEEGGGYVLTSDPTLVNALRDHEFFKNATKADAEAAGAALLTPNADGSPPTPDEPDEGAATDAAEGGGGSPEPQAPAQVNHEAHSREELRALYGSELGVAEADVPQELTRRQLADAINQGRASGSDGGAS